MLHENQRYSSEFIISEYLQYLEPTQQKSKYICPKCGGHNLSIHKDGKKYNCFDGCYTKEIAYELRKLNGEFNGNSNHNTSTPYRATQPVKSSKIEVIDDQDDEIKKLTKAPKVLSFLQHTYQGRLAYNVRSNDIELDGDPIDLDCIRIQLSGLHNIHFSKDLLVETVLYLALQNQYDPVKNYLERCRNFEPLPLEKLAVNIFGCPDDELYQKYLETWLISCVARVYQPGCKSDETLVLQGEPGLLKSTFFRAIANDFFSDSMTGNLDKDDLTKFNEFWVNEWSELDGFTAKVYHGKIKHFLSKQRDDYRLPYGRSLKKIPRRSVIVGTTNRDDFLNDPTGNRRFKVIPVRKRIDVDWVESVTERIWSSVIGLYENGHHWWLTSELQILQAFDNDQYEQSDPWEDILIPYVESQKGLDVTTKELIDKLCEAGFKSVGVTKTDQMRVADILKRNGWKQTRKYRGDSRIRVWVHEDVF